MRRLLIPLVAADTLLATLALWLAADTVRRLGADHVAWSLVTLALPTLIIVATAAAAALIIGGALILLRRWWLAADPLVEPTRSGALPVARSQLARLADRNVTLLETRAQGRAVAAIEEARRVPPAPTPASIVYSPHYAPHYAGGATPPVAPPAPEIAVSAPASPPILDMASLVEQPTLARILLAVGEDGQPIYVAARALVHVALAGPTGGGKSNIIRLLLSQLLAAGATCLLADPHFAPVDPESGDDWRPIVSRLTRPPIVEVPAIAQTLRWLAEEELEARLARRRAGQRPGSPLFLALDELPVIVAGDRDAPAHLGRILREGRKVGIFAITAAQDFLVKTIGGSSGARDCFRTAYYTGGDPHTARALLDVRAGAVDDGTLGQGIALLRSRATPQAARVHVPLASNAAVARLLPPPMREPVPDAAPTLKNPALAAGTTSGTSWEPAGEPAEPVELIQQLAAAGASRNEIAAQLTMRRADALALIRQVLGDA